jgi:hypothetical protein
VLIYQWSYTMRIKKLPELLGSIRAVSLGGALWGLDGLLAHSQQPPAPPIAHTGPVLPGTHVPPRPLFEKPDVVLHIDGPITVTEKRCTRHTFDIKYTVINHSGEPANGTIRATFKEVALDPVGPSKLNNLLPGKTTSGAFVACCPASGLFTARLEYRDSPSESHADSASQVHYTSDSVNISCK